ATLDSHPRTPADPSTAGVRARPGGGHRSEVGRTILADTPRGEAMADDDVFGRINALSDEEEHLWQHAGDGHGLTAEEHERLDSIKVELDRCYDLLNQREARRAAG